MVGAAAGGYHYPVVALKLLASEREVLEYYPAAAYARLHGVLDGAGLLHDLLHHEVLIAALLGGLDVPDHVADGLGYLPAGAVVDGYLLGRQLGKLAVFHVYDVLRPADQGSDVAGEVVLPDAEAEDEGACLLDAEQPARLGGAEHAQHVAALQARGRAHHRALEVAVVVLLQQVRHDFRVRLAGEDVALRLQLAPERGEVLDYAVVDDGEQPVLAQMRVGVGVRRRAVGRPSGVGYAAHAAQGVPVLGQLREVGYRAAGLDHLDALSVVHGHARAVIPAVFQPAKTLDKHRRGLGRAGKSYNSAHMRSFQSCRVGTCALTVRLPRAPRRPSKSRGTAGAAASGGS